MLRLDLSAEARWIELGHGVRIKATPLTTAVMLAAHADPEVIAIGEDPDGDNTDAAHVVARVIARSVIEDWDGIGDADGEPAEVTPENIDALFDIWPMFEAFQTEYVLGSMLLDAEKNVSAPSPNGSSAGVGNTATPA